MKLSHYEQLKVFLYSKVLPNFVKKFIKSKKQFRLTKLYNKTREQIQSDCDLLTIVKKQRNFELFISLFKKEKVHETYIKMVSSPKNNTIEISESSDNDREDKRDYLYFLDDLSSDIQDNSNSILNEEMEPEDNLNS